MAVHRIRRTGGARRSPGAAGIGASRPPIRFFPGWAGTLLWWPFPVDYVDTALPAELVVELTDWEARWEARASAEMDGPSEHDGGTEVDERRRLRALAERVAEQLGSGYCLELDAPGRPRRRKLLIASDGPGVPAVVSAFERLENDVADDLYGRRPGPGPKAPFYAYAPLSGTVFDPSGVRRPRRRDDE